MQRRITYISGTRADFGLMTRTLQAIAAHPDLSVDVLVTGMHLSAEHGDTVNEIRATGLPIVAQVPVPLHPASGATMARGIGAMVTAFTHTLEHSRPDLVLLLGDRGEMLAGAIAAVHLNIPVAHIHGGERSGTVDEPVRHAISKLAHIHMTATQDAHDRLIRMGEAAAHVHVTGAPGLDGLTDLTPPSRADLAARYNLDPAKPLALMVFHPVLQEADEAAWQTRAIIMALEQAGCCAVAVMPNADAGSAGVRATLEAARGAPWLAVQTHLQRADFVTLMAGADVMIGNSSAGIIEAASFGTPVINMGRRQNLRARNANVRDVPQFEHIGDIVRETLAAGRYPATNIYGDGQTAARIAQLIATYPLTPDLLMKVNGN